MLWYKAWLETRVRYLIFLAGAIAICSLFILHADRQALYDTGPTYFHTVVFYAHQYLAGVWVLAATLLAMGGLLREKAVGASSFTLAFPVQRSHIMWARIGSGVVQVVTLGIVPWIAIFLVAQQTREPITVAQASMYVTLLLAGGLVFFAVAVLISVLTEGEYTAPAVAFGVAILIALLFDNAWLRPYSPWRLISASDSVDRATYVLVGPLPWPRLVGTGIISVAILLLSVRVVERREF